jgi:hypothetical protein
MFKTSNPSNRKGLNMSSVQPAPAVHKSDPKSSTPLSPLPDELQRKRFLKRHRVAALIDVHPKTLLKMWLRGEGPTQRKLGPRIDGSTVGDVEDYLDACKV